LALLAILSGAGGTRAAEARHAADSALRVWVELRDKGPSLPASPERAYEDAPVHRPYLEQLQGAGFAVSTIVKWQNRVSGRIHARDVAALRALAPVLRVEEMPRKARPVRFPTTASAPAPLRKTFASPGLYQPVFDSLQATRLRDAVLARGLAPGQGVRIALIDAGFDIGHDAFQHLRARGARDQWDFVGNDPVAVNNALSSDNHGALVLSPLAARSSTMEGLAPDAEYLYYRAEDEASEAYVEEDYVAAAIERAVDSGAQVINISLGYRYDFSAAAEIPYASMNGRTRPASLAALGAARRNVLVSVAMGNEGATRNGFPSISSPADADSILAVSMLSFSQVACSYASGGPSSDGRIKPDLSSTGVNVSRACDMATVTPASLSGYGYTAGTSLAAPVITGIAALLRQLHPTASAQAIRSALIATAGRATLADSTAGYGLARAWNAHVVLGGAPVSLAPSEAVPAAKMSAARARDARGRVRHADASPVFRPRE
jgi:subtilisin family serine protease